MIRRSRHAVPAALLVGLAMGSGAACGGSTENRPFVAETGGSAGNDGATGSGGTTGSGATGSGIDPNDIGPDVSEDTPIADLDDDELEELCDDVEALAEDIAMGETYVELSCRSIGIVTGILLAQGGEPVPDGGTPELDIEAFRKACQESYDQCVANPPMPGVVECSRPGEDCEATLEEFRECAAAIDRYGRMGPSALPSCEDATVASLLTAFAILQQNDPAAACEAVQCLAPEE